MWSARTLLISIVLGLGLLPVVSRIITWQSRQRSVSSNRSDSAVKILDGAGLQAALNSAKCGETITLQAGVTYETPKGQSFVLPYRPQCASTDSSFITIISSNLRDLPAEGVRVAPKNAAGMPRLVTNSGMAVIYINQKSHHYRFVGIEFTNVAVAGQHAPNLVLGGDYASLEQMPHHIEFDRCFFHPIEETTNPNSPIRSVSHAISINGKFLKLSNSYISGFMGRYITDPEQSIDSMGIIISTGPFIIENNYIAAWFNNILIGGSDPPAPSTNQATVVGTATLESARLTHTQNLSVGDFVSFQQPTGENGNGRVLTKHGNSITFSPLKVNNNGANSLKDGVAPVAGAKAQWNGDLPTHIEIRYNTFDKPSAWKPLMRAYQPKAWIEIKLADGLLIDGNVFQGYPSTVGTTVKNQSGSAPWSTVRDVTITNNRFTSFGYPFIFNLRDELRVSTEGGNVTVANNLCTGPGGSQYYGFPSKFVQLTAGSNVQIYHNTCFQDGDIVGGEAPVTRGFVFRDNIVNYGTYGMNCMTPGGFASCWPGLTMRNNLIIDTRSDKSLGLNEYYPRGNYFVRTISEAGFLRLDGQDYRLSNTSRYKQKGSDGTDPGVDLDALNLALGGAR